MPLGFRSVCPELVGLGGGAGGGNGLLTNLVSYWKMDEASGNALDAHSTNDLTDNNSVGTASGKINGARDFENGSAHYFSRADNAALSTGDIDFSFSLWVNFESIGSRDIINKWGSSGNEEFFLLLNNSTNKLDWYINGALRVSTTGTFSTSTWYHVVCWHDAVNNQVGIAINDGTPDTASYSGGGIDGSGDFAIGANPGFTTNAHDGLIDEVGFWKKVLSAANITALNNSGNALPYSSFT